MELRPIGKKADLSLSVNAIVILVLAITMLGLGLGFLRGTFKRTIGSFEEVSEEVKTQIIDKIKSSNEKVAFDKLEVGLKRSESKDLYFGVRNVLETTGNATTFYILPYCEKGLKSVDMTQIEFATYGSWDVKQGEVEVLKMVVTAKPAAALDTYACNLKVCTADPGSSKTTCPEVTTGTGKVSSDYAIKKFFVVVGAS